jgi:hypothetical protein
MKAVLASVALLGLLLTAPGCGEPDLPDPADFPVAGPGCSSKTNVSPWVGTPTADSNRFHCVLTIQTCGGPKTYKSGARAGGTGMCDDYWKVHGALANREICCTKP